MRAGKAWLDPIEVDALLSAYAIPVAPVVLARDPDEAARLACAAAGGRTDGRRQDPLARYRPQIRSRRRAAQPHQRAGGRAKRPPTSWRAPDRARPDARITGVTLHPMVVRPKARELIAGIADDPTFGPIVVFGAGGTAVEVISDKALALPPLDLRLAQELIGRTRIARVLKAYRDVPAADETGVALVLVKLAQLAADLPEIRDSTSTRCSPTSTASSWSTRASRSRRSAAAQRGARGHPRFAVRPYPKEWERNVTLRDGTRDPAAADPPGGRDAVRGLLLRRDR